MVTVIDTLREARPRHPEKARLPDTPVLPKPPLFPTVSPEMRNNPEALANRLIDHINDLRKYERERTKILNDSYNAYLKSCQ